MGRIDQNLGTVLRGVGVAPGIALGVATRLDRAEVVVERVHLPDSLLESEVSRLYEAITRAESEVDELHASLVRDGKEEVESLGLLVAHKHMLRDQMLLSETEQHIREEGVNAEWALTMTVKHITDIFERMEDPFFRERGEDVVHVGQLLLRALSDELPGEEPRPVAAGAIIIADVLSPAEALSLSRREVGAFVLDGGTPTSHTAIIARSLGIPAVMGLGRITELVGAGDRIIVDGTEGEIILRPTQEEEVVYSRRARRARAFERALRQNRTLPATTPDGVTLTLRGNLDVIGDHRRIHDHGGEGVGLFRTEFLYLDRPTPPSEDEQFTAYVEALEAMAPHPVTIRTLDIGGDKLMPRGSVAGTDGSGLRAIRFCLQHPDLFHSQLRALFRASAHGNLRLLVPFISCMSEVRQVKAMMTAVRRELEAEGVPMSADIPLGFMIEVPAAAMIADLIARQADFFSVGTNDLIQFTLAISRNDATVDYLNHPLHPAMLRILKRIADAGRAAGLPVGMCGEMAGDPRNTLILLALGFTELSMNAGAIPMVKEVIRRTPTTDARALLDEVMALEDVREVADVVESYMVQHFSDIVTPKMRGAPPYPR